MFSRLASLLFCGFVLTACGSDTAPASHHLHADAHDTQNAPRFVPDGHGHMFIEATDSHTFGVTIHWSLDDRAATLRFSDAAGEPAARVENVRVILSMPIHGHDGTGTPVASRDPSAPANVWNVNTLSPSMSGDWQLTIEAVVNGKGGKAIALLNFPPNAQGHSHAGGH